MMSRTSGGEVSRILAGPFPHPGTSPGETSMSRLHSAVARAITAFVGVALHAVVASAATFWVDQQNPAATDAGPGTLETPYRTISAAVTQRGGAGNTIVVRAGVYPEQVTVGASGAAGTPFVIQAEGVVTVDGADAFDSTSLWAPVAGDVFLAASVTWPPIQVFADGQRLTATTVAPSTMPAGTFQYVAGVGLYVNAGGGNPGARDARVGRRTHGFRASGRTHLVIRGFQVTRAEDKGIYVQNASSFVTLENNRVTLSRSQGINVTGSTNVTVAGNESAFNRDHGILLTSGVTASTVIGNLSHHNARVVTRGANGIHLFGSPANRVERNRVHDNEDSGFQNNSSSHDNVYVNNVSWRNGDHGYDHLGSTNVSHVSGLAYGNTNDGFSFEGNSPGGRVHDCIAVDNGLFTNHYDLFVDGTSLTGFTSNDNVIWNSTAQAPLRYGSGIYPTLGGWTTATGQDARSTQADPRFVNGAAGDFHLLAGSPAIDAADAGVASFPALDAEGRARVDDPNRANTGLGTPPFADRGPFEFVPTATPNRAPFAVLRLVPQIGTAPLTVLASGASSVDQDGVIVSYRFDFGDGGTAGPQPGATASHVFAAGTWLVTLTVTDDDGATASATQLCVVTAPADRPPVVTAPASVSGNENQTITVNVSAADPDSQAITALTADLSGLPAGHNATFVAAAGNRTGTLTWTPSFAHAGTWPVVFRAANALTGSRTTSIAVANVDRAPVVVAPDQERGRPNVEMSFTVTASDPDGDAITAFTANFSDLPSGHNATFTVNASRTSGTFRWTPTVNNGNFDVVFTASNARSGSDQTRVQVRRNGAAAGDEVAADAEIVPSALALAPPRPNPSRGPVAFALDLPRESSVRWSIHDVHGRELWRDARTLGAGRRALEWSGGTLGGRAAEPGLYWIRVEVDGRLLTASNPARPP
jgi:parallel beta-helix repeat protein